MTEPLLEGTREFSLLFPMASMFFSKAAQNCVFWLWSDFILAKPTQSCVFWPKCFFKNSWWIQSFLPIYLDLQLLGHGDFQVFGSKWPQIRTTYLCRTQNSDGTLKGRYQVNLQEKINHNQNFSEFSETEAINLKKVASFFQDAIHLHPGHLQRKTLIFTIRALVE